MSKKHKGSYNFGLLGFTFSGKKFESEFAIEQDKFILIPFLLKESLLFVSNMPRGNFA